MTDLLAETPRGQTPRADKEVITELKQAAVENRVSYVKAALALDKIGGLDDNDSDCDSGCDSTSTILPSNESRPLTPRIYSPTNAETKILFRGIKE